MKRSDSRKAGILLSAIGGASLVVAGVMAIPMKEGVVWGDPFFVVPWLAGVAGGVSFLVLGLILVMRR
jgi:aminoglycoside phosphotransferase (APT) family kinase protein